MHRVSDSKDCHTSAFATHALYQVGVVPAYALTAAASAQHKLAAHLHLLRVYTKLACISEVHKTQAKQCLQKTLCCIPRVPVSQGSNFLVHC